MLRFPEGQMGEAWKLSKKICALSDIGKQWMEKRFPPPLFFL
jgi:hypothetical protein